MEFCHGGGGKGGELVLENKASWKGELLCWWLPSPSLVWLAFDSMPLHVANGGCNIKGTYLKVLHWRYERGHERQGEKERIGRCGLFICPIVADSPSNPWRGILARLVLRWSGQGENSYCGLIGLQILPLTHLHSAKTVLAHMWMNNRSAQVYRGVILRCTELCWGELSKNIARGIVACGQIVLQWW